MFESLLKPELQFKTLTGSIVTFNSQYALPLKSHTVDIDSVSGVSAINITRTGKNLCPPVIMNLNYNTNTGEEGTNANTASSIKFPIDNDKTYVLTKNCDVNAMIMAWDAQDNFVGRTSGSNESPRVFYKSSFTSGDGTKDFDSIAKIAIRFYRSGEQRIEDVIGAEYQIESGDTATAYQPFGTQTTINIGQTVNEGEYDARTGILEVTLPSVQTIQLPPCPIDTIANSVNNIWADTGDTTLQYPKFG